MGVIGLVFELSGKVSYNLAIFIDLLRENGTKIYHIIEVCTVELCMELKDIKFIGGNWTTFLVILQNVFFFYKIKGHTFVNCTGIPPFLYEVAFILAFKISTKQDPVQEQKTRISTQVRIGVSGIFFNLRNPR